MGGGSSGLLAHDVDSVEVAALEIVHALLLDIVGNVDVDSVGGEHAMDLRQHLSCVGARDVAAQNRVELSLS